LKHIAGTNSLPEESTRASLGFLTNERSTQVGTISAPPSIHHQKGPGRGEHGGDDHEGEVPAGAAVPAWLTGELRCGRRLEEAAGSAARGTGEDDGVRLRALP